MNNNIKCVIFGAAGCIFAYLACGIIHVVLVAVLFVAPVPYVEGPSAWEIEEAAHEQWKIDNAEKLAELDRLEKLILKK